MSGRRFSFKLRFTSIEQQALASQMQVELRSCPRDVMMGAGFLLRSAANNARAHCLKSFSSFLPTGLFKATMFLAQQERQACARVVSRQML